MLLPKTRAPRHLTLALSTTPASTTTPPHPHRSAARTAACIAVSVIALGATIAAAAGLAARSRAGAASIRFFVIGDWGRSGTPNQTAVAHAMGERAATARPPPVAVISVGDNFYQYGLVSHADPRFDDTFVNVYTHPALANVPWYNVPGNHDWGELKGKDLAHTPPSKVCAKVAAVDANAACQYGFSSQLHPHLTERNARWHAARAGTWSVPGAAATAIGGVTFFFFDSSPFIEKYRDAEWARHPGGLADQFEGAPAAAAALAADLRASRAGWKFVVSHHPPSSLAVGARGDDVAAPLREATSGAKVAAILSGHDHLLSWLARPAAGTPPVLISGGGSDVDKTAILNATAAAGTPGVDVWMALESGFADCVVRRRCGECTFVGVGGRELHKVRLEKP